jgi:4'-phosphopantetheinyl transferase
MRAIYVVDLKDAPGLDFGLFVDRVSEYKRARLLPGLMSRRSVNSIVADLLVQYLLAKCGKGIDIVADGYGKPRLVSRECEFSISHSGDIVACVLSDKQVGLDIEVSRPLIRVDRLATRALSGDELIIWNRVPVASLSACFLQFWTLKESFLKMSGQPIIFRDISFAAHHQELIFVATIAGKRCFFSQFECAGCFISVCDAALQKRSIKKINPELLIR